MAMFVMDFPINTTLKVTLYPFIYHFHYDVFRPVIAAIFGQGYGNIKGKK
jgi:hypothetical protein